LRLYECNELKGILYPYGNYITNDTINGIFLHNRFNINDWCVKCDSIHCEDVLNNEDEKNIHKEDNSKYSHCKPCSKQDNHVNDIVTVKQDSFHMFPSQNSFVYNDCNSFDSYEKIQRMNAFAVYPNIRNCLPNTETKLNQDICKKGLCKATKPLFI
jgi:hypothetical protein